MQFEVSRSSNFIYEKQPCAEAIKKGDKWYIEIKDLAHLLRFARKYNNDIIIKLHPLAIEIYDDWRE